MPYNLVIPLLGIYPKKTETLIQKNICTLLFIAALFTIAKIWKQPKCPSVDEWIKKLWYIYLALKKKKILFFVTTWMDLKNIILSEMKQSNKDKYHKISIAFVI